MLPEELSNELCSLKPDVDRLCMVCDMTITQAGVIKGYSFYPGRHAFARAADVQRGLVVAIGPAAAESSEARGRCCRICRTCTSSTRCSPRRAEQRGAIDFETVEMALEFDPNGKIEAIVPVVRNEAHKLIEECMLAANVCAAEYLLAQKHPALYRVHEGPTPEKLAALREFLGGSALRWTAATIAARQATTPKLLDKIQDRPDFQLLQTVLLRSLQQAVYSPDNAGHFGLAYEAYTHFTSPIRRYPDLLVHRAIKAVLAGERYTADGKTGPSWACTAR